MNRIISLLFLFTVMLGVSSCEKDFDIEYHPIPSIPVIEASVTQDGVRVCITRTTPMDEPMDLTRITDAEVSLADLTSGTVFHLVADDEGYFTADTHGVVGHNYELSVDMEEQHFSATSLMRSPVTISDLGFYWIKMPYDQVAALQLIFECPSTDAEQSFWVRVYKNGEFYKQTIVRDTYSTDGTINVTMMTSRRNPDDEDDEDILRNGDLVTATVAPISEAMYDYIEGLQNNSNSSQIFSGDFCLGYFLAAPVARQSVIYNPDEITAVDR